MLVLSLCALLIFLWLQFVYRQLQLSKNEAFSALTSIDNSLTQQIQTLLKVVHYAEIWANQKEIYLKFVNEYRHACQSDSYSRHQCKQFNPVQEHLKACNQLSQTLTSIAAELDGYGQYTFMQDYLLVHSEFSSLCRHYNQAVEQYNLKVKIFPSSIIAHIFQFTVLPFFDLKPNKAENFWINKTSSYQY